MSVYTTVDRAELAVWLQSFDLGELREHVGIAAGMQNSNYFVTTTRGRYVLTLFESLLPDELDFYLTLQAHLAVRGIPCPHPLVDAEGQHWRWLNGKPAALMSCLAGAAIEQPGPAHCRQLGEQLARLHLAGADFPAPRPNPCGLDWCQRVAAQLLPLLSDSERHLLEEELELLVAQDFSALPRGVIHADLFRDNVLWSADGQLSGVLDFYFAGADYFALDLAVAVNDWCAEEASLAALCAGYAAVRPLTAAETAAWPGLRRLAALRFWLLRLEVRHRPRSGDVVTIKNPEHFRALLMRLRLAADALPR